MAEYQIVPYGTQTSQFVEWWDPVGAAGAAGAAGRNASATMVLLHGGYWRHRYGLDLMHAMATHLCRQGHRVINVEYRRVGEADDPWPAMAADVTSALGLVPDDAPVVLIGHSAGGHLALWAAATAPPRALTGVVALAPLADLDRADRLELSNHATRELFGSAVVQRAERIAAASPLNLLPLGCRQVLVHGGSDDSVPQDMAFAYTAAARRAGDEVELITPDEVDHFDIIDPDSAVWALIEQAFEPWAS